MPDTESKASAHTTSVGYYTRWCPPGCSPLKITRQQKWISVLGYLSEPLGFLEPAGTPGRLCLPFWCTQCAARHLPFCAFCWLSAKNKSRTEERWFILDSAGFSNFWIIGCPQLCFLAEAHTQRYGFWNNWKKNTFTGGLGEEAQTHALRKRLTSSWARSHC